MAVWVAEVARVNLPRSIVRFLGQRCASRHGLREQRVHVRFARNDMTDAELSRLRRSERNVRVLGQLRPRVERQRQPIAQVEHHNVASGSYLVTFVLGAGDAGRSKPETVAVEPKPPVEVTNSQSNHVDASFHLPPSSGGRTILPFSARSAVA